MLFTSSSPTKVRRASPTAPHLHLRLPFFSQRHHCFLLPRASTSSNKTHLPFPHCSAELRAPTTTPTPLLLHFFRQTTTAPSPLPINQPVTNPSATTQPPVKNPPTSPPFTSIFHSFYSHTKQTPTPINPTPQSEHKFRPKQPPIQTYFRSSTISDDASANQPGNKTPQQLRPKSNELKIHLRPAKPSHQQTPSPTMNNHLIVFPVITFTVGFAYGYLPS